MASERFRGITKNKLSKANKVITAPEEVTPEWLTYVLHRNGVATDAKITAAEVILRKELQVSTVYRLGIGYNDSTRNEGRPRSVFLKLPRVLSEELGMVPGSDDRAEVEFYREIAPAIGCPPLIRCYDAEFSEETKRSHILLEDLFETHSQPEQTSAPSEEMSRLAVEAMARAHSAWWSAPSGSNLNTPAFGLPPRPRKASATPPKTGGEYESRKFDDKALSAFISDLNESVTAFLAVAQLTMEQERGYRRMLDAAGAIWGRMTRPDHLTVTHGDLHWWNFLYPKDTERHRTRVFDWQLWHIDLGARDLAFLLALGGFAEPRPKIEEELLRVYHETLGVEDYSWEMLIEDYRWSAIRNLNIPVIFWKQGKHESTWRDALRRAWEGYERLGCGELLF